VIEFYVVADLDAQSAEVTLEDRHVRPQRGTALHGLAIRRNYKVHFAINPGNGAVAPEQNSGIRAPLPIRCEQVRGSYDVAAMFARFSAESLAQRTFQRDRTGTRILTGFPGDGCFGQDGEVRTPPVLLAGLFDHAVHKTRELVETLPQSWVRAPKIQDGGADDYFARQCIGRVANAGRSGRGGGQCGSGRRQTTHARKKCSAVHQFSLVNASISLIAFYNRNQLALESCT
jgi:hypothetical protein